MHDLAVPGAIYSEALALNNHDSIVGDYQLDNEKPCAVLWENGNIIELDPQRLGSKAWSINTAGAIVGWSTDPQHKLYVTAVIWENGEMKYLNQLVKFNDENKLYTLRSGHAINDKGQILATGCKEDFCTYFILTPTE